MYLRDRTGVALNVNPYLQLTDDPQAPTQALRAARLLHSSAKFVQALDEQTLEPDIFHMGDTAKQGWFKSLINWVPRPLAYYAAYAAKSYPLDMSQYVNLFSTTRVPRREKDELRKSHDRVNVAVLSNGHFYRLPIFNSDLSVRSCAELQADIDAIVDDSTKSPAGAPIASLTTADRDKWADARDLLKGSSGAALDAVEGALFTLSLEHSSPTNPKECAKAFLYAPEDRWYDKSLQLTVTSNGRASISFEHSWGDGVCVLRYANEVFEDSMALPTWELPENQQGKVERLQFNVDSDVSNAITAAQNDFKNLYSRVIVDEIRIAGYGKDFFKAKKLPPDGVVQNVIQLAYRAAFGGDRPVATYESASTAGFKCGRTETIRPATLESKAFVDTMLSESATKEERYKALKAAALAHRSNSTQCAMGQGVDRHMFALRKMAEARQLQCDVFSDPTYAKMNHNILSTSTLVSDALDGGGFGPVVPEGFGVGYATKDSDIGFVVSTYGPAEEFFKFRNALVDSLNKVKEVL